MPGTFSGQFRSITRTQWDTLLASNLGWLFDGFETYALFLTVGAALHQLLEPALLPRIPVYAGSVIAITILGWGIGGMLGGVLADYFGRKRMMILAITMYSLTTGLSALSYDWVSFAVLRFLVGLAIGSEWATGTSMMAELWPASARGKGAGLMQCGMGIGFFIASFIWLFVGNLGPNAWRYMFLIGILPALATLWIRRRISESDLWERANEHRRAAVERKRKGERLQQLDQALTRFTLVDLFFNRKFRRRTVVVFLISLSTTLAWWGVSSWIPPYIASVAAAAGYVAATWASFAGMAYNTGGILGYICFGFLADAFGRKPVTILFFVFSLALTPVLFMTTRDPHLLLILAGISAFFTLGVFSWMPVWLPELYPTHVRATAVAFGFNAPRIISALGPFVAGALIVKFGGYANAAVIVGSIYILGIVAVPFLPETRGKPLPDTI